MINLIAVHHNITEPATKRKHLLLMFYDNMLIMLMMLIIDDGDVDDDDDDANIRRLMAGQGRAITWRIETNDAAPQCTC